MLNHKGTKEIKTNRLFLRAIKKSDYKDIYKYTSKDEVSKYVTWNTHKSINDTKAVCKMWADEYINGDKYHWAIVYSGAVIGNIEIIKIVGTTAFLGWQLDCSYWNRGIMSEAAAAVRDYMFFEIGAERLSASHILENIGSGRVMQKIGMKQISFEKYCENLDDSEERISEINGMPIGFYSITRYEWFIMNVKKIDVSQFDKCSNIWNLKNSPYTDQFRNELSIGNRETYVFGIGDKFIAEASFVFSHKEKGYTSPNKRIYLSRIIVKKEYRNIGLGKMMLNFMVERAREMGYSEITIGVDCDNHSALHIYKKAGFKRFETAQDEQGRYFKMELTLRQ